MCSTITMFFLMIIIIQLSKILTQNPIMIIQSSIDLHYSNNNNNNNNNNNDSLETNITIRDITYQSLFNNKFTILLRYNPNQFNPQEGFSYHIFSFGISESMPSNALINDSINCLTYLYQDYYLTIYTQCNLLSEIVTIEWVDDNFGLSIDKWYFLSFSIDLTTHQILTLIKIPMLNSIQFYNTTTYYTTISPFLTYSNPIFTFKIGNNDLFEPCYCHISTFMLIPNIQLNNDILQSIEFGMPDMLFDLKWDLNSQNEIKPMDISAYNHNAYLGSTSDLDINDSNFDQKTMSNLFTGNTFTTIEGPFNLFTDDFNQIVVHFYAKIDTSKNQIMPLFSMENSVKNEILSIYFDESFKVIQIFLESTYWLNTKLLINNKWNFYAFEYIFSSSSENPLFMIASIYMDNQLIFKKPFQANPIQNLTIKTLYIGTNPNNTVFLRGYIRDFRVVKAHLIIDTLSTNECKIAYFLPNMLANQSGFPIFNLNKQCLVCEISKYLWNNKCLIECPLKMFNLEYSNLCDNCNQNCLSCYGSMQNQCYKCTESAIEVWSGNGTLQCLSNEEEYYELNGEFEPTIKIIQLTQNLNGLIIEFYSSISLKDENMMNNMPFYNFYIFNNNICKLIFSSETLQTFGKICSCGLTGINQNIIRVYFGYNVSLDLNINIKIRPNVIFDIKSGLAINTRLIYDISASNIDDIIQMDICLPSKLIISHNTPSTLGFIKSDIDMLNTSIKWFSTNITETTNDIDNSLLNKSIVTIIKIPLLSDNIEGIILDIALDKNFDDIQNISYAYRLSYRNLYNISYTQQLTLEVSLNDNDSNPYIYNLNKQYIQYYYTWQEIIIQYEYEYTNYLPYEHYMNWSILSFQYTILYKVYVYNQQNKIYDIINDPNILLLDGICKTRGIIKPYTLLPGKTYKIIIDIMNMANNQIVYSSIMYYAILIAKPIIYLTNINKIHYKSNVLTISAEKSFDVNYALESTQSTMLNYYWNCYIKISNLTDLKYNPCKDLQGNLLIEKPNESILPIFTIQTNKLYNLLDGEYIFTVKVNTQNDESSTKTIIKNIQSSQNILYSSIHVEYANQPYFMWIINQNQPIYLKIIYSTQSNLPLMWEISDYTNNIFDITVLIDFDSMKIIKLTPINVTNSNIILNLNIDQVQSAHYDFSYNFAPISLNASLIIDGPYYLPKNKSNISQLTKEFFLISTNGWLDDNSLPIFYQFYYAYDINSKDLVSDISRNLLTYSTQTSKLRALLPIGNLNNSGLIYIGVIATDSYGARAEIYDQIYYIPQILLDTLNANIKSIYEDIIDYMYFKTKLPENITLNDIIVISEDLEQLRLYRSKSNCSNHGIQKLNISDVITSIKCYCDEDWILKDCSLLKDYYQYEYNIRNSIIKYISLYFKLLNTSNYQQFFILLSNPISKITKIENLLDYNLTYDSIESFNIALKETYNIKVYSRMYASLILNYKALNDYLQYIDNILNQITLYCSPTNNHTNLFNISVNTLALLFKIYMSNSVIGQSPLIQIQENFKIYQEKVNSKLLKNKNLYIDNISPIVVFGNENSFIPVNISDGEPTYSLRYIYWPKRLLECILNSHDINITNIFITIDLTNTTESTSNSTSSFSSSSNSTSLSNSNSQPISPFNSTPFDILYPKDQFDINHDCIKKYSCKYEGLIIYSNGYEYHKCHCNNVTIFSESNQLLTLFGKSNLNKIFNYAAFNQYEFYKSIIFYLNIGYFICTILLMIWGCSKDKQVTIKPLDLLDNKDNLSGESKTWNMNKNKCIYCTSKAISFIGFFLKTCIMLHTFCSIFTKYDPQHPRSIRFMLYYLRVVYLMTLSALFYEGIDKTSYSQSQLIALDILSLILTHFGYQMLYHCLKYNGHTENQTKLTHQKVQPNHTHNVNFESILIKNLNDNNQTETNSNISNSRPGSSNTSYYLMNTILIQNNSSILWKSPNDTNSSSNLNCMISNSLNSDLNQRSPFVNEIRRFNKSNDFLKNVNTSSMEIRTSAHDINTSKGVSKLKNIIIIKLRHGFAYILIFSSFIACYWTMMVITAHINIEISNEWAIHFLVAFLYDLLISIFLKVLLNIILLLFIGKDLANIMQAKRFTFKTLLMKIINKEVLQIMEKYHKKKNNERIFKRIRRILPAVQIPNDNK